MIYSYLLQTHHWIAGEARNISPVVTSKTLLARHRVLFNALLLALAIGGGLIMAPPLHAQDAAVVSEVATVNINTADAAALAAALNGVGESRAQDIVRHREAYGPFASAEELTEVKGIGQSTLDKNREVITLE